jgi:hypothetical protein
MSPISQYAEGGSYMSLISQYEELHRTGSYGNTSLKAAPWILPQIRSIKPCSVIDYGCGQSLLPDMIARLGIPEVARYDPAIPAYSARPRGHFDLLINIDMLEHIPERELDPIIADMAALAHNAILVVDTRRARITLPNGQNAHATIKPVAWWRERLSNFYPILIPITYGMPERAAFRTWQYGTLEAIRLWVQTTAYRLSSKRGKEARKLKKSDSNPASKNLGMGFGWRSSARVGSGSAKVGCDIWERPW